MGFRRGDVDSISLTTATTSTASPLPAYPQHAELSEQNVALLQQSMRQAPRHNYENAEQVFRQTARRPITVKPVDQSAEIDEGDFCETRVRAYSDKVPDVMDVAPNAVLRYTLLACAIVFQIAGFGILCLFVWLKVDNRLRALLSERYQQTVNNSAWSAMTVYALVYVFIAVACLLIINGCIACCAVVTSRLRTCLAGTFFAFNIALFFAILAVGIYVIVRKSAIENEIGDALNYMVQHYYQGQGVIQQALDHIQIAFHCCGNSGCSDFRQLRQDIPRSCDIDCQGCRYRVYQAFQGGATVLTIVLSVVLLAQLLSSVLAILYCVASVKQQSAREERERLRMRTIKNTLANSTYRSEHVQRAIKPAPQEDLTAQDRARADLAVTLATHKVDEVPASIDRQSYVNAYTQQPITYKVY